MKAILLAAGYGTRIRSLFPDTPKALIEVGGRALIDHLIDNLAHTGAIDSITVVTNDRYLAAVQSHFSSATPPIPTDVLTDGTESQAQQLGALGDLHLALRRVARDDDVLVAATDRLLAFELGPPLRFAAERSASVNLCLRAPHRRHLAGKHGCVVLDNNGLIIDFEEKPAEPRSNIASMAIYVLTSAAQRLVHDYLRDGGNTDAPGHFMSWLIGKEVVYGYIADGSSYDVGTPESYAEAQRAFLGWQCGAGRRAVTRSRGLAPGVAGSRVPVHVERGEAGAPHPIHGRAPASACRCS